MTDARRQFLSGLALLVVLAIPPVRHAVEAGMATHMLIQYPALLAAGALLGAPFAGSGGLRAASFVRRCNALGIAGLVFAAAVLGISMIPRLLDLALVDARVESLKWLALVSCGAALRVSWREAGLVVQGFFLGNVLPMTAVVGTLYQDAPMRLCNNYRLDEQQLVGAALIGVAIVVAAAWLGRVVWSLQRDEAVSLAAHRGEVHAAQRHERSPEYRRS